MQCIYYCSRILCQYMLGKHIDYRTQIQHWIQKNFKRNFLLNICFLLTARIVVQNHHQNNLTQYLWSFPDTISTWHSGVHKLWPAYGCITYRMESMVHVTLVKTKERVLNNHADLNWILLYRIAIFVRVYSSAYNNFLTYIDQLNAMTDNISHGDHHILAIITYKFIKENIWMW